MGCRTKRLLVVTIAAAAVLLIGGDALATGAGSPDPTFGTGGFTVTPFGSPDFPMLAHAAAVAVDANGGSVVLGVSAPSSVGAPTYELAVLRYLPTGTLDPDFGTGGVTSVALDASATAGGIAIDSQGRIVADGFSTGTGAVLRLLPDGSRDPSFGVDGVTQFAAPGHASLEVRSLVLGANDRPVVVGDAVDPGDGDGDAMLARLGTDGTLDATFGSGGFAFLSRDARSFALFVAARGGGAKIAAAGWITKDGGSPRAAVFRFGRDGSPDGTFSQDGSATYRLERNTTVEPTGIAVRRSDGEVYVASWDTGQTWTVGLAAFSGNGLPDAGFGGGDGRRAYDPTGFGDVPMDLARASDGGLVVSGGVAEGSSLLMRVTSTGEPDASFGTGGVALNASPGGSLAAVTFDPKGRIVGVGSIGSDILIGRFRS
ncbi:MAG: hypothetical protein ACJ76A_11605 [Actinomycetota bacterium]